MASILKGHCARQRGWALLLGVLCILSGAPASFAQQAEIDSLASRVAQEIAKTGKKNVAVADFVGVNGKSVPLGTWLADQFSAALAKADPNLEIIDRAKVKAALQAQPLLSRDSYAPDPKAAKRTCKSIGAEILVKGTLGPAGKAVGITLNSFDCLHSAKLLGSAVAGKIPLRQEMETLLPESLDSLLLPGGVWVAGQGGASEPSCVTCPSPDFPGEAVLQKHEGEVEMEVTVSADGRARDITITKSDGSELDQSAVQAVRKWKFKPALDPNGRPVTARTVINVTFRLMP